MSHPQAPSVPRSPGPPPAQDPNRLTNAEAEQYVSTFLIWFQLYSRAQGIQIEIEYTGICKNRQMYVDFIDWLIESVWKNSYFN